jgi:nucleotide-binding universal stress UspA family protein
VIDVRHILCPVDFSDTSRAALDHAVAIGRWYHSQITALHVIPPALLLQPPMVYFAEPARSPWAGVAAHEAVAERVRAWLAPAVAAGLQTDVRVEDGDPAARIVECAAALPADLLVIGTHGQGPVERFLLGSVAEKVLRKAACPVLTVPPAAVSTATLPYKRLLCPIDFSESSLSAFKFACAIAKESNARLSLLHVFESAPEDDVLVARFDTPEFRRVVEQQARAQLEALVTADVRTRCRPETHVDHGKPYRRILEAADREKADLIVIGVRGRNPLDVMLFGSTTNHVVRRASCPVLTLKF